jgi:hypothetical protein
MITVDIREKTLIFTHTNARVFYKYYRLSDIKALKYDNY